MGDTKVREIDIFREAPVRYLGYANEVGESFRSMIARKWVRFSYVVATLYVLADTADKSIKTYKTKKFEDNHTKKVLYTTTDTMIWQLLASVAIPGYTINRICAFTNSSLTKRSRLPTHARKWVVTSVGLCSIPFIIRPIDHFVDFLLDISLRKIQP